MTLASNRRPSRLVLCLNAREPAAEGGVRATGEPGWRAAAREVLDHARGSAWPVAHVFVRRPALEFDGWRAIRDLGPEGEEPVFHCDPPDPLENLELRRWVAEHWDAEILLVGASLAEPACLAAALFLSRRGRRVAPVREALAVTPKEWQGLEALACMPPELLGGAVRLARAAALTDRTPALRLIVGGRR